MSPSGYIAVVFDPSKEKQKDNFVSDGWSPLRPCVFPFSIQLPEGREFVNATYSKTKNGGNSEMLFVQKYKSIFFRPSANLDILRVDWEYAINDLIVQWRLNCGSLVVIEPDKSALEIEPLGVGYRMFSLENALRLVSHTKDLGTLQEWGKGEKRLEVQEAIAQQEDMIERHLRMLRES